MSKRTKKLMSEPSIFEIGLRCSLHPKYKGLKLPVSKKPGCVCGAVYVKAQSLKHEPELKVPVERLIEAAQARKDPALHRPKAPEGYHLRGVSTLMDSEGHPVMTWVKTTKDALRTEEIINAFRDAVAVKPLPKAPKTALPKGTAADLACVIPLGDLHVGMLSWPAETGEDYNLKIARTNLLAAVTKLVELTPPADTCLIINLGDGLHADGYGATTTKGTKVDVDGRYPKMLQIFIEAMVQCILLASKKHKTVRVINEPGNHDVHAAYAVTLCLAAFFKDNPNVVIETGPGKFHYFEFGNNLIGSTHGDTLKINSMGGVMATDQAAAWGRTKYRRMYVGHVHHTSVTELPGCVVETVRTIAPKDAWATAAGYRSGRSMFCDVWHKTRGKILRHEVEIENL